MHLLEQRAAEKSVERMKKARQEKQALEELKATGKHRNDKNSSNLSQSIIKKSPY